MDSIHCPCRSAFCDSDVEYLDMKRVKRPVPGVSLWTQRLCVPLSLSLSLSVPAEALLAPASATGQAANPQHADYSNSRPRFQKAPARRCNEWPALWASNIKPCLLFLWIIQTHLGAADHPGNSQEN